jgi:hypothetical protein
MPSPMSNVIGVAKYVALGAVIATVLIGFTIAYPMISKQNMPTGVLALQMTDPPVVPTGVTDVVVQYSDVFAHISTTGDDSGWYKVAGAGSIDLMSIINVSQTIGSSPVPVGRYNSLRFNITSAVITFAGAQYQATVPSGWIRVPLRNGGISVTSSTDAGVLIDLAPTVIASNDNGELHFVLLPVARGFPIPGAFQKNLEHPGAREGNSQQKNLEREEDQGRVTIPSLSLSQTSLNITVKNIGSNNVTLTHVLLTGLSQYSLSSGNSTIVSELRSYQDFVVLSNGNLEIASNRILIVSQFKNGEVGYTLPPDASITLSYTNASGIQLINQVFKILQSQGALVTQMQSILPNTEYGVGIYGSFEAHYFTYVMAA